MKKAILSSVLCLSILLISGCQQTQSNQPTIPNNSETEVVTTIATQKATITNESIATIQTDINDNLSNQVVATTDVQDSVTDNSTTQSKTTKATEITIIDKSSTKLEAVITDTQSSNTISKSNGKTTTQELITTAKKAESVVTTQKASVNQSSAKTTAVATDTQSKTTTKKAVTTTESVVTTQKTSVNQSSAKTTVVVTDTQSSTTTKKTNRKTTTKKAVTTTESVITTQKTSVNQSSAKTTAVATDTPTTEKSTTTTTKNNDSSERILKVLNIGNSFGHNATSYLADVAAANGKIIEVVNLHKDGCSLQQHWKGYEEDSAQYTYELNGTFFSGSQVTLKSVLDEEEWDVIVTHPSPSEAAQTTYQVSLKKLVAAVKKHCPEAKFYVMQTWALGDDYAHLTTQTGLSRKEMWEKVEANSKLASITTRLPLIPCGAAAYELEAWFEENRPELSFYQNDDCHAADTWGWYLLSLVWYQTITGEVPNDAFTDFDSAYTNDPVVRAKVHEIAKAAVAAYD